MFNKKQPSINAIKELTGEHLRAADKLVRLKRYDEALQEIENASKIDPENEYTRSFLERTRFMIDKENERRSQVFGETDMTSEHRMEAISQLFASVEEFIKEKKYPKALNELAKVYHIDPKNYYAQVLSDRIITLMRAETAINKTKTLQAKASGSDAPPSAETTISTHGEVPTKPTTTPLSPATLNIEQGSASDSPPAAKPIIPAHDDVQVQPTSIPLSPAIPNIEQDSESNSPLSAKMTIPVHDDVPIQPANISPPPTILNIEQDSESDGLPLAKTTIPAHDDVSIQPANFSPSQLIPISEQQEEVRRFALYRELLKECWADGVITPEESDMLHRARVQYSISFDTHSQIEVDIKMNAYVDALLIVWRDGVVTDNEQEVLEIMRKKFGITPAEQVVAEKKFFALHKSKQATALILIVDDDYNNSIYVARALINHGYDVRIEQQPDDALHFLSTKTPDLILSEAVFPQFETDGFEFFQKTHLDERLSQIPFLMMTNPDDGCIIRAGLRMGVDYFIPKPIHIGYMISIVEGKLKSGLKTTARK